MLVQLYQSNLNPIPEELEVSIYNGYFGGTVANPNLAWFNTAQLLDIKYTANLTSLQTITQNLYTNNTNDSLPNNISIKISGYFRAKQTGVCRFFTKTDDASFIYINDVQIVNNGGTHSAQNALFGNVNVVAGTYYKIDIYYGESTLGQWFSAGYLEGNSTSTNTNDFITNATGLTTYYEEDPTTQTALTTSNFPLILEDATLQGLFRVSPIALYFNRTNFTASKHDILYLMSDDLFNNFNGTYRNYIQLHEKPVANDVERKRFTQFSSDMSFECELNGRIEVSFRRGQFEPNAFRYAMLILDVERIPVKQL